MNNDSFYHLIKGGKTGEKKGDLSYIQMLDFILIRNWFLSLVNFPHLHEFITKLPI